MQQTAIPLTRQPVLVELDEFERRILEGLRELREKIVRSDEQRRIEFEAARTKRRLSSHSIGENHQPGASQVSRENHTRGASHHC